MTYETAESLYALFSTGLEIIFYITTLVYICFSLFMVYHWFAFGTEKATAMSALVIYLVGSMPLFLVMGITLFSL